MKKILHLLLAMLAVTVVVGLSACSREEKGAATLVFEQVDFRRSDDSIGKEFPHAWARYYADIEWPVAGDTAMRQLLQRCVLEGLRLPTTADSLWAPTDSLRPVLKRLSDDFFAFYRKDCPALADGVGYSIRYITTVEARTERLITYNKWVETYLGGASAKVRQEYANIDLQERRILQNGDILLPHAIDTLRPLLARGLLKYFREEEQGPLALNVLELAYRERGCQPLTAAGLDKLLCRPALQLDLPQGVPGLTEQGLAFRYQPGEIAHPACGMPIVVIPYDSLPDVLAPLAKELALLLRPIAPKN